MSAFTVNENGEVVCPDCGGTYMHHSFVEAIFRDFEDGPGTVAMSYDEGVEVRRTDAGSIPGHRDVLKVTFWCEGCGESKPPKTMMLMQDKGRSRIEWLPEEE